MTRFRLLSLAVVALLAAGLVACGGDSGGDEDPQQVLDETFNGEHSVTSGVIDLSLSGSAEGQESGSLDASINGPFQEGDDSELPELDLTGSISAEGADQSIDFSGGITTTADGAFITYEDQAYEVPEPFVSAFQRGYEQAQRESEKEGNQDAGGLLEQYGIDPENWLTNLSNEGDADVEGTNTIHIHGDADVPRMVEDLQGVAEKTGEGVSVEPLTDKETQEVEDAVEEASVDVYSGADDRILRRLEVNLALSAPQGEDSDVDSVDATFSVTLSGVNEEQTIEAPPDAQSFENFETELGIPPGLLEQMLGGGSGESIPFGGALDGGGGGGSTIEPQAGTNSQQYLNCIAQAETPEDLQACEP